MKTKLMFVSLFFCAGVFLFAGSLFSEDNARIKLSGIMGQSQPEGQEPLPFIGTGGIMIDKQGTLWTAIGDYIYGFRKKDGEMVLAEKISLITGVNYYYGIKSDGEKAFLIAGDFKVYSFDPATKKTAVVCDISDVKDKLKSFCVFPSGLDKGYAGKGKIFTLEGINVHGYKENGEKGSVVFTLPPVPEGKNWWYGSIGIEPNSGDLLAGSYYPDYKIYRFGTDGKQVTAGAWPRELFSVHIVNLGNLAWALTADGGVTSLPLTFQKPDDVKTIPASWTMHVEGLAEDDEGYWISSAQGISQFDKSGKPAKKRIGGINGVRGITVASDGTVLASIENGQRMIVLSIDDDPNTSLTCNANEPFRVGGGWTGKACRILWDGKLFLVLDETAKKLWHFDPWHTTGSDTPWILLSGNTIFRNPLSMAFCNGKIWILDDTKILEGELNSPSSFKDAGIPVLTEAKKIAGSESGIVVSSSTKVTAYSMANGKYKKEWEKGGFGDIVDISSTSEYVGITDKKDKSLTIFSSSGAVVGKIKTEDVKNGFEPGALAISQQSVLVYDDKGKRILRFKIAK